MTILPPQTLNLLSDPDALLSALPDGAIGYVGLDIPEDVLAATGKPTAHLPWRVGRPTPFADEWLETSFPENARSILEDWSLGAFDHLSAVVFTRGDDVAQRLWYYICELRRRGKLGGPEPIISDMTHIRRDTHADYAVSCVERFCASLNVTQSDLANGISIANRRRKKLNAAARSVAVDGVALNQLARASLLPNFENVDLSLNQLGQGARPQLLLAGSTPPDGRLHEMIFRAGANVGLTLNDISLERLGPVIPDDVTPFEAVGRQANLINVGPRTFHDIPQVLTRRAQESGVDGIIFWAIEEDEARAWHVPRVKAALESAGIPNLVLTRRAWRCDDDTQARIETFIGDLS